MSKSAIVAQLVQKFGTTVEEIETEAVSDGVERITAQIVMHNLTVIESEERAALQTLAQMQDTLAKAKARLDAGFPTADDWLTHYSAQYQKIMSNISVRSELASAGLRIRQAAVAGR